MSDIKRGFIIGVAVCLGVVIIVLYASHVLFYGG